MIKGMDIGQLMKSMQGMQETLSKQMEQMNDIQDDVEYIATAGDDGIEVTVVIDGNINIKSISCGEELKNLIDSEPEIYFSVLFDLIIAAFHKAKEQIVNNSSTGGIEDMIPNDMKDLLKNFGGLGGLLK